MRDKENVDSLLESLAFQLEELDRQGSTPSHHRVALRHLVKSYQESRETELLLTLSSILAVAQDEVQKQQNRLNEDPAAEDFSLYENSKNILSEIGLIASSLREVSARNKTYQVGRSHAVERQDFGYGKSLNRTPLNRDEDYEALLVTLGTSIESLCSQLQQSTDEIDAKSISRLNKSLKDNLNVLTDKQSFLVSRYDAVLELDDLIKQTDLVYQNRANVHQKEFSVVSNKLRAILRNQIAASDPQTQREQVLVRDDTNSSAFDDAMREMAKLLKHFDDLRSNDPNGFEFEIASYRVSVIAAKIDAMKVSLERGVANKADINRLLKILEDVGLHVTWASAGIAALLALLQHFG